jgi:hypothetical protein
VKDMAGSRLAAKKILTDASATAMSSRFDGYGPEEERSSSKAEIKETEAIRQLRNIWKALESGSASQTYGHAVILIRKEMPVDYTAEDVEDFSLALSEFQDEGGFAGRAGCLLSALINYGKGNDYVIHTKGLQDIRHLGYCNQKNIVVKGHGGVALGFSMHGGRITVDGDAHGCGMCMYDGEIIIRGNAMEIGRDMIGGRITVHGDVGGMTGVEMRGGEISVDGDVSGQIGWYMKGGRIIIKGETMGLIGDQMEGGEIHLDGRYEKIKAEILGGQIFHKGELIAGK